MYIYDESENGDKKKETKELTENDNNKESQWTGSWLQGMQSCHCMLQQKNNALNFETQLILVKRSTFSSIHNKNLITKVKKANKPIMMKRNTGTKVIQHQRTVEGFKKNVWCNPDTVVNIFGFKAMKDQYRITNDSAQEDS